MNVGQRIAVAAIGVCFGIAANGGGYLGRGRHIPLSDLCQVGGCI